jgi:two-component system phosphate regulon response regulator PhoB
MARVRAILRRHVATVPVVAQEHEEPLENGLVINRNRYQVTVNGKPVNLTLTEFQLLSFLASKKGWVFSRNQIVDAIHGEDYAVTDRSIDVVISGLRKKLKSKAYVIETVRGVGYRYKE